MSASSCSSLAFPKQRPKLLDKRDRAAELQRADRIESAKVKRRAKDRCEVIERFRGHFLVPGQPNDLRCVRRPAPGNHHLIGGIGRKNVGRSILAEYRLAVCAKCHEDITGHVLQPAGTKAQAERAATVIYQRISR